METRTQDDEVSAQIQAVLEKMRPAYIANLVQRLDTMEALVMELNRGEDFQHCYETLYRAIHSLKGSAGTYGISILSTICQPFENYLSTTLEGGSRASDEQISTCLHYVDLLRKARDLVAAGREFFPEIEASLGAL